MAILQDEIEQRQQNGDEKSLNNGTIFMKCYLEERISVLAECTDLFHDRPKGPPKSEQDIRALLQRAEALDIDPFFPLAPDDYRKGVLSNISGSPGTLAGPNEQLESPPSNATTPGALNQPDPLDVVGTPDPTVFPFNTDVEGNIGS